MALAGRQAATSPYELALSTCRRPRKCRLAVSAATATPINKTFAPNLSAPSAGGALHQQPGRSYVNFKASAEDFHRVMARLQAACALSPEARAAQASVGPATPTEPKAWGGLFGGLIGGLRSSGRGSHLQDQTPEDDHSHDDGSPLSHALVMFTATWCGPCSVVYKELKLATRRLHGRPPTAIIIVDVDEHKELASELGIKALPTLLYMSPDASRGPIFTQGPVSASFILDTLDRAVGFGGRNVKAKWLKL